MTFAEPVRPFNSGRVSAAISALRADGRDELDSKWLGAVAALVRSSRPDIAASIIGLLGCEPSNQNVLDGLTIGEVGVVYEAVVALQDAGSRKANGQFFTPDDVSRLMAEHTTGFPGGVWLDPCTGVGNLSWHLVSVQADPAEFVRDRLALTDRDGVALRTAVALITRSFAADGDTAAVTNLWNRSQVRDFLADTPLPAHDFVIANPPYARADRRDGMRTAETRELFAYFLDRIADTSKGFVAVTPAAWLNSPKYQVVRDILDGFPGGDVLVFDSVPGQLFSGYKYGSANTSTNNFVRAAITIARPDHTGWRVTPILRWAGASRQRMLAGADKYLTDRRIGPDGEWAKVMPGTEAAWDVFSASERTLADLVVRETTGYRLDVASTPRYYISATGRDLDRGSKHTLYFRDAADRDLAYLVLNSSLPYWWWRTLDGGVTLPRRTLLSTPLPAGLAADADLLGELRASDAVSLVSKLNAGRNNENIKHPRALVERVDARILSGTEYDFTAVFAPDVFAG